MGFREMSCILVLVQLVAEFISGLHCVTSSMFHCAEHLMHDIMFSESRVTAAF